MNGTRARKIRKSIYTGDEPEDKGMVSRIARFFKGQSPESFIAGRTYRVIERSFKVFKKDKNGDPMYDKDGKRMEVNRVTRQVVCTGLRAKYKQAKRAWKEGRMVPCSST